MIAYFKLTRRRRLFVDAYVRCGVGTQAMREIGFKGRRPDIAASKWMGVPDVKAAIAERTEQAIAEAGVRSVRVLEELARVAFFDPRKLRDELGNLKPFHELEADVAAAISSIEVTEEYSGEGEARQVKSRLRKYRTHPKIEALKLLGQHLKLFTETHEVFGKNGGPIETKDSSSGDLNTARRIAFLLASGLRASQAADAAADPVSGEPG